jgi:hypothetical protein
MHIFLRKTWLFLDTRMTGIAVSPKIHCLQPKTWLYSTAKSEVFVRKTWFRTMRISLSPNQLPRSLSAQGTAAKCDNVLTRFFRFSRGFETDVVTRWLLTDTLSNSSRFRELLPLFPCDLQMFEPADTPPWLSVVLTTIDSWIDDKAQSDSFYTDQG